MKLPAKKTATMEKMKTMPASRDEVPKHSTPHNGTLNQSSRTWNTNTSKSDLMEIVSPTVVTIREVPEARKSQPDSYQESPHDPIPSPKSAISNKSTHFKAETPHFLRPFSLSFQNREPCQVGEARDTQESPGRCVDASARAPGRAGLLPPSPPPPRPGLAVRPGFPSFPP